MRGRPSAYAEVAFAVAETRHFQKGYFLAVMRGEGGRAFLVVMRGTSLAVMRIGCEDVA
jgi:hypothetical protein